ncbi:MAG: hypothetical protein HYR91_00325 [Flavobacteriia bacterium]|nr:hypothetical protein [Flavobacteriia bacterium]
MINEILELKNIYGGEYSKEETTWFNSKSYQPMYIHFLSFTNDMIKFNMKFEERTSFFIKSNGYLPQFQDVNILEIHFQKEINNNALLLGSISKKVNWFNSKKFKLKFKLNRNIKNINEISEFLKKNIYNENFDADINFSLKNDNISNVSLYFSYNYKNIPNLLNIYNSIIELIRLLEI